MPTPRLPGVREVGDPAAADNGPGGRVAASRPVAWVARHLDGAVAALLTLAAAVVYLLPGLDARLDRDPGVYAYGGQQVAEGVPPYVGILNRAGPLAHLVPGAAVLLARVAGKDDLLAVRALFLVLAAAAVGVTYLLARRVFDSRQAGLVAALALLAAHGLARAAVEGPREKTVMVLLLLLALLAGARGAWLLAGACVALATLTWQPVFLAAFAGVLTMALLVRPGPGDPSRRTAALRVVLGGLAPTALAVLGFALVGHLRTAVDAFVLINLRYTEQPTLLSNLSGMRDGVERNYGPVALLLLVGLVASVALAVLAARGPQRHGRTGAAVVGLGAATLGSTLWTLRATQSWADLFVLLPVAAAGLGGLVAAAGARLPRRGAVALTALASLLLATSAVAWAVDRRGDVELHGQRALVDRVQGAVPEATVVSLNAPDALVLLETCSETPYQMFGSGFTGYYEATYPGGLAGYVERIRAIGPDLVVVGTDRSIPSWAEPLREDYVWSGRVYGWVFLARQDLPDEQRRALRRAVRRFDPDRFR